MSSSLNKAMIIGRLGQDPEVRFTKSNTAVANLSIATSEKYKNKQEEWIENTEWHKCTAWGRTAEICQEYLKKGSQVYVEGPIQTREWEDKEGNTRYSTEIKALKMQMLGGNSSEKPNGSNQSVDSSVDLNDVADDAEDDLPF